jgi:hypothetical protein
VQRFIAIHCHDDKKMKRKFPITFIFFVLSLIACTKILSKTDKVFIRIENTTTENFSNFALNGTDFGGIASGDTSKYVRCEDVLPIPFSNQIAINNNFIYIVDIVPTPYMKNGKYLMKVVKDTLPHRYDATFIEE